MCHGPGWLSPSAGKRKTPEQPNTGSVTKALKFGTSVGAPSGRNRTAEHARAASQRHQSGASWLSPAPGRIVSELPQAKRGPTTKPKAWHWLCPPVGREATSWINVQRSASQARRIHLDLVSLLMIDSKTEKQTNYQINGAESGRIRKLLSRGCRHGCMQKLKAADVITFCNHLHSLSEDALAHYLHTAYETCGDEADDRHLLGLRERVRIEWYLLGHHITVDCLQSLLGMTSRTFYKKCHGTLDMRRFPAPSGHTCPQGLIVDQFFCELYCSAAERLPEVEAPLRNVDAHIESHQVQRSASSAGEAEPLTFLNWTPHQQAMDVAGLAVSGNALLPARHLQHCRLSDLWWQFVAWHGSCEQIAGQFPCPSWSTFWRRWHARWKDALRFRTTSQHSQCKRCFQCSAFLHKGNGTPDDKRQCAAQWRDHLTGQYHDRLVYWHMAREKNEWMKHKADVTAWKCQNEAQRAAFK